jgi:hypothetical protein
MNGVDEEAEKRGRHVGQQWLQSSVCAMRCSIIGVVWRSMEGSEGGGCGVRESGKAQIPEDLRGQETQATEKD